MVDECKEILDVSAIANTENVWDCNYAVSRQIGIAVDFDGTNDEKSIPDWICRILTYEL